MLWGLGGEGDNLWYKVVAAKYRVSRSGMDISGPNYHFSGLWKSITYAEESFDAKIKFRIGNGVKCSFGMTFGLEILS